MKKLTIILSILVCACNAQTKKQPVNTTSNVNTKIEMTTEKFDIETFEKNKTGSEYNFVLDNGTQIRQTEDEDDYSVYEYPLSSSLFMTFKKFYKENMQLQQSVIRFPNNFLKLRLEYDKSGKLIEEIDYDIPYKFSFEKLIALIKNEKVSIDIFDRKNTTIGRSSDEKGTFWYVTYKKVPMRREVLKVDGITGEILERSFYPHEDN